MQEAECEETVTMMQRDRDLDKARQSSWAGFKAALCKKGRGRHLLWAGLGKFVPGVCFSLV